MRLLVDTNIFLDIIFERKNLFLGSSEFLRNAKRRSDVLYISTSSLKDISYFLKKSFHDNKKVNEELINIYSFVNKVIGLTSYDGIEALYKDGDYEDNALICSAERTMCDAIITRNIKDFSNKTINCFTPEEYLAYIK